jgi:hypothetical protein
MNHASLIVPLSKETYLNKHAPPMIHHNGDAGLEQASPNEPSSKQTLYSKHASPGNANEIRSKF